MNDWNERMENPSFFHILSPTLSTQDSPDHDAQQRFLQRQSEFWTPNFADLFAYDLVIACLSMLQHSIQKKHTVHIYLHLQLVLKTTSQF